MKWLREQDLVPNRRSRSGSSSVMSGGAPRFPSEIEATLARATLVKVLRTKLRRSMIRLPSQPTRHGDPESRIEIDMLNPSE